MSEIVLIDGNNILKKAFYHVPIQANASGFHTNAICGFLNVLLMLAVEEKTEYMTIVFGQEAQQDKDGGQKALPESFREQIPVIKEILASMNVNVIDRKETGTADLIKAIANRCADGNTAVTVVSGDRSLLQLVSETVTVRLVETGNKNTRIVDYHKDDAVSVHTAVPGQYADIALDFSPEYAKLGELDTPEAYAKLKQLSLDSVFGKFGEASKNVKADIDKDVKVVTVTTPEDAKKVFDTAVKSGAAAIRILNIKAGNAGDYKTGASGQLFFQMDEGQDVFGCMVCGGSDKEEQSLC